MASRGCVSAAGCKARGVKRLIRAWPHLCYGCCGEGLCEPAAVCEARVLRSLHWHVAAWGQVRAVVHQVTLGFTLRLLSSVSAHVSPAARQLRPCCWYLAQPSVVQISICAAPCCARQIVWFALRCARSLAIAQEQGNVRRSCLCCCRAGRAQLHFSVAAHSAGVSKQVFASAVALAVGNCSTTPPVAQPELPCNNSSLKHHARHLLAFCPNTSMQRSGWIF